jgi:hypothetical protein
VSGIALLVGNSICIAAVSDLVTSGKTEILANPFIAYGVNPVTHVITGYIIALRTVPGRTDVCRFAFMGNTRSAHWVSVKYLSEFGGYEVSGSTSTADIIMKANDLSIKIKKRVLGGDCDWILPFTVGPSVTESKEEVSISLSSVITGDWIGVSSVASVRARFHDRPDAASVQRAFLVQGDLIYVYEERPGWYYVKYEGRKKTVVGWIRKSDTVQINFR